MVQVAVSIGSNVERERHISSALDALTNEFGELRVSPVYESLPVYKGLSVYKSLAENSSATDNVSLYYNLVAVFDSDQDLETIKQCLRAIEQSQQRERHTAEVTLDLDLLLYGDCVGQQGENSIPHSDVLNCAYTLRPLAILLPEAEHPVVKKTYGLLWQQFSKEKNLEPVDFVWQGQLISTACCMKSL